jgi:hypothetical protein
MKKKLWWGMLCALALLVSACGGGSDAEGSAGGSPALGAPPVAGTPAATGQAVLGPLAAPSEAQRSAAPLNTAAALFEWAQQNYPQYFSGPSTDGTEGPFSYRFYSQTSTYLALSADGGVYVKGPDISGNQVQFIAPLALLGCTVSPASCPQMNVGSSATGSVAAPGERDWHAVFLSAGQGYSFTLEGAPTGQGTLEDPALRLFDSAGRELTWDDDSGVSFNANIVCAPSASGWYYLAAEAFGSVAGSYRLSVAATGGPAVACQDRPGGNSTNWQSAFSAPEILQGTVSVGPQQSVGASFQLSEFTALEAVFVSAPGGSLYLMNQADLPACLAGGSFNFFAEASFQNQSGFKSFSAPPGSYAICARNQGAQAATMRLELQKQTAVSGFRLLRQKFEPVAQSVPANGRLAQAFTSGDQVRTILEGANSGGLFYIIPASETDNFMAGRQFLYRADMTRACGEQSGTAAPDLCEIDEIGDFVLAYINNTSATQSVVLVAREYVPE